MNPTTEEGSAAKRRGAVVVGGAMALLVVFAIGIFVLPFAFPTPPPIVTRFSGTQLFSPGGDGARDTAMISVRVREPGRMTLDVADSRNNVVRTLADDAPTRRGWVRTPWDGRDNDGEVLPDGDYSIRINARSGKQVFRSSRRIRIDTVAPIITAFTIEGRRASTPYAPCRVELTADSDATAQIAVRDAGRRPADPVHVLGPRPVRGGKTLTWDWDASVNGSRVSAGLYIFEASVADQARNSSSSMRNCWVGHISGRPVGPTVRAGQHADIALQDAAGVALAPSTRVRLQLYRRVGTPGSASLHVLGDRVARPVTTRAGSARIRIPATTPPQTLWLVATTDSGRALISLTDRTP